MSDTHSEGSKGEEAAPERGDLTTLSEFVSTVLMIFPVWLVPLGLTALIDLALIPLGDAVYWVIYILLVFGALFLSMTIAERLTEDIKPEPLNVIPIPRFLEAGFDRFACGCGHLIRCMASRVGGLVRLAMAAIVLFWSLVLPIIAGFGKWLASNSWTPFYEILFLLTAAFGSPIVLALTASLIAGLWPKRSNKAGPS